MKKEYDFSTAVQGKFYRPIDELKIPVYLEKSVREYYAREAKEKNLRTDELINSVLKREIH